MSQIDLFGNEIKDTKQKDVFLEMKTKDIIDKIKFIETHRKIKNLSEIKNLNTSKVVSIRRKLAEIFGKLGTKDDLVYLENWLTLENDSKCLLIVESSIDKIKRRLSAPLEVTNRIYTVSEALEYLKRTINEKEFSIQGEISDSKLFGQITYFALKDKQDTRIECRILFNLINRLNFPMNEGIEVLVKGKFALSKHGKVYFDISYIQLTGEGELLRNLKILEKKLEVEGLFDISRKRELKKIPKCILLIASNNSAAIKDFLKVLNNRRTGITIYHLNIKTQGVGAEYEIVNQLSLVNELVKKFEIETVIITRGGGSKDDLFVFNSEKVVRLIHSLLVPSIVAIGHEQDFCLAEKVADMRASTPSNAAELVSVSNSEISNYALGLYSSVLNFSFTKKKDYQFYTNNLCFNLQNIIAKNILNYRNLILESERKVFVYFRFLQSTLNQNYSGVYYKIYNLFLETKSTSKSYLHPLWNTVNNNFSYLQNQFSNLDLKIKLLNPKNILKMGYSIVWSENEIAINSKDMLLENKKFKIEFSDGIVDISEKFNKK
jgi:exodeoxyribonuclease VII large subunit